MVAFRIRLTSAWRELTEESAAEVGGRLGVYELRSNNGEIIRIGYAGGRSRFGLRSELEERLAEYGPSTTCFRYEVTSAYLSRYRELLMVHVHDYQRLPRDNSDELQRLGRLHPS